MNSNKVLEMIGSKWTILIIGILMLLAIPTTYGNLMVVFKAGEMSKYWYIPTIFLINLITAVMAFYGAAARFFNKGEEDGDWEEE